MRFSPRLDLKHPDLRTYILLTLPLMVGLTMTFSTEVFFRFFGSYLPGGSIAALNYALRVMFIIVGLVGQAVGVASYPFMARLASAGRLAELNDLLNTLMRYLAVTIPLSVLVIILRQEVVLVLFQRGAFTAASTALTARALAFIMLGAFAFSAQTVVARGFYAMQNTLLPTLYTTAAVVLSLPFYVLGMKLMGIEGVALACAFSATLQVVVLYAAWNRKRGNHDSAAVYRAILKILVLSVFLGGFAFIAREVLVTMVNPTTFVGALVILVATSSFSLLLLVAAGYVLKVEEITSVPGKVARKIIKK
jgi:putative peptidoglycan lipid II flippase